MKILAWCDSPTGGTGFARVSREVLKSVHKALKPEIEIIGINQIETYYDQKEFPYKIVGNLQALTGDQLGIDMVQLAVHQQEFDVFFTINNPTNTQKVAKFVSENIKDKGFKWIAYIPLEQDYLVEEQLQWMDSIDQIVMYTPEARDLVLKYRPEWKDKVTFIEHGTDLNTFKQLPKEVTKKFRETAFNLNKESKLFVNVSRNDPRKNLAGTIKTFITYWMHNKNSKLYLHTNPQKPVNLPILTRHIIASEFDGMEFDYDSIMYAPQNGFTDEIMNKVYNAADAYISTSYAEGWGLPITEAMATKTPVIAPNNTAQKYLLGDGERGVLIPITESKINAGESLVRYSEIDYENIATLMDDAVNAKMKVQNARSWVVQRTWEKVNQQWVELFKSI